MPLPPATMQDDAKAIKDVVEMLGKMGREVVVSLLLLFSYIFYLILVFWEGMGDWRGEGFEVTHGK